MSNTRSRLSTNDILNMCHLEDPVPYRKNTVDVSSNIPSLVPTGGLLLAGYLTMNAPPGLYKTWRRYHREWKNGVVEPLTIAEFEPLLKIIGPRFHGYMITAQGLFNAQNKQRFYITFVARYHGLSTLGSDLMSSLGWLVPSTTYDRCLVTMLEEVKAIIRYCALKHDKNQPKWI
jgi:hypothetical protein